MKEKHFTEEQIIAILREQGAGAKTGDRGRKHGIVPGLGYKTVRCDGYAANLNSVEASDVRAFCPALI